MFGLTTLVITWKELASKGSFWLRFKSWTPYSTPKNQAEQFKFHEVTNFDQLSGISISEFTVSMINPNPWSYKLWATSYWNETLIEEAKEGKHRIFLPRFFQFCQIKHPIRTWHVPVSHLFLSFSGTITYE